MMNALISGTVLLAMTLIPAFAAAQKVVILTRHAERADGLTTMMTASGAPADPPLSEAGKARVEKLTAMLADANITAMFTTEFRRTKDTALESSANADCA